MMSEELMFINLLLTEYPRVLEKSSYTNPFAENPKWTTTHKIIKCLIQTYSFLLI